MAVTEVSNTFNENITNVTEDELDQNPNIKQQWVNEVISYSSQYNDVNIFYNFIVQI